MRNKTSRFCAAIFLCLSLLFSASLGFQSDELLAEDEEFGLEGGRSPDLELTIPTRSVPISQPASPTRRRGPDPDLDSKIQFPLEHAFGESEFSPAGTFSARLKTWSHGGQTLTKLRFSREAFSETEKEKFKMLLEGDDFYKIRVPSNVLSPPGRDYIISSVKARCLPRDRLDEHFVIHMEGVNILAVNYGSPGACPYPRQLKLTLDNVSSCDLTLRCCDSNSCNIKETHQFKQTQVFGILGFPGPAKWSFNSHTVLKNSEQAPRTPAFAEEILGGEIGDGEAVMPPERSFWAKYWMYLIPLGLVVMNAVTQAMNMPEEQAAGQSASQSQPTTAAVQRGPSPAVRRR